MSDPTDHLRRYADHIAASVTPARSQIAATRAIAAVTSRSPRRLTGRVAVTALAGLVVLNVGAMSAANAAVPGDFLYPLDRAYERIADAIGVGADRTPERVAEAQVLLERSDPMRALQVLAEVDDPDVSGVAVSLWNTADDNPLFATHVTALVANTNDFAGPGDDRSKAEALAAVRLIGSQVADVARDNGNGMPPTHADTQGPPAHAGTQGPPDHAANDQGNQGNSANQGNSGNQDNPGNSGNRGSSGSQGNQGNSGQQGPPDHSDTQGPPDHSDTQSPPDHASSDRDDPDDQGSQGNQGNQGNEGGEGNQGSSGQAGPPDHAGEQGPPDHSGEQGPPDHAGPGQGKGGD